MTTLTNPKNGDTLTTELKTHEATEILGKLKTHDFARSLLAQLDRRGSLSDAQWFWFFKIAEENKPGTEPEETQLKSDLHRWLFDSGLRRVMWKINERARMKIYVYEDRLNVVYSGGDFARRVGIIKGDTFFPNRKCPTAATAQLLIFSEHKINFLKDWGKKWGRCCVCGRELENEESVAAGIGPICAGRLG